MKKIIGWILFVGGIIIILWPIKNSYQIFTAKKQAPEVFRKISKEEVFSKEEIFFENFQSKIPQQFIKKMVQEQITQMIPSNYLIKLFNLISWSIFVTILIFGGGKLSILGIKLLK